jgi:ABC-type transporter Mla subunit MlaD
VVLAAVAVLSFNGIHLGRTVRVKLFLSHAGNVKEGADVQVAGQPIGRVESIQLVPERAAAAVDHPLHDVSGGVVLVLRLEAARVDWTSLNSEVFVASKGLLGEPYLEIGLPPAGQARGRPLSEGDQVRGVDPVRLDRVMTKSFVNLSETRVFFADVAPAARELSDRLGEVAVTLREIDPGGRRFGSLVASLRELGAETREFIGQLQAGDFDFHAVGALMARTRKFGTAAKEQFDDLASEFSTLRSELDRIRERVPTDLVDRFVAAFESIQAAVKQAETTFASARQLFESIGRGEGTVGALLNDPEFADDAKELGKIIKRQPWRVIAPPQTR